ncbi:MAG: response regulator [Flavobacterium sp.]|jgi:CheY-like chemotaxis protein|uniref:response regulator n=1 Tax=unclassified Flavobacterium TaxID=196869 RepID=UPI000C1894DA|nr:MULTISPECIES: response regulator [unclassified Flavobacterium]MDP3682189.1 response regulator [Flavobacterium sp.]MDZ4329221.1 response regulator [Flavobacterium sp.]PIF62776.1 response regulator receiver domain-containing protein [Flavobacterium sp. 11]RKS14274.1 response regulator receiver domain-containing protein [Flavobacterium sp. 120]WKL44285.1 response regulator [Flavobacterium sp. ZE23DGlu08]
MTKKAIWVIDDDAIYQIIINKIIQRSEMFSTITSFKNGKEAIDALHDTVHNKPDNTDVLPDIILLDINMPIMDGWEFMEKMGLLKSKFSKNIIVYIVSSSIATEDKNKSKTYSDILGYLSKPVTMNDLELITSND